MKNLYYLLFMPLLIGLATGCGSTVSNDSPKGTEAQNEYGFIDQAIERSSANYKAMLALNSNVDSIPRSIHNDGQLYLVDTKNWTSGFYSGSLWYLYEATQDSFWLSEAKRWTENLEGVQRQTNTHDIGFIAYCSYGNGFRLTGDESYLNVLNHTAITLSKRFNPTVGCTKSWNRYKFSEKWQFPVIIDNMMNMELLFFSAKKTQNDELLKMAKSHSSTTMNNHFRDDYSSYHVLDYDSITGEVIQKNTHQGLYDSSSWARGQTWGLYGFTFCARETGDSLYLKQAKNIANYIMTSPLIPEDKIPLWDYMDTRANAPRDASAAALTASALLELSQLVEADLGISYIEYATDILRTLSTDAYLNKTGENHNFIILHCTGNHPKGTEIDKPLNYGDYYFLEALLKLKNLKTA